MKKGIYSEVPVFSKLLIFISLFLVGFGLATIVGLLSVQFIMGLDVLSDPAILADIGNRDSVNGLKMMQFLHHLGIFIFPPLFYIYLTTDDYKKYLKLDKRPAQIYVILAILLIIMNFPILNFLIDLNQKMELPSFMSGIERWMKEKELGAEIITQSFMEMNTFGAFLLNVLIMALAPAIGEELLFRGLLQNQLARKLRNVHAGIWITAFLFSAIHLQFFGFLPRFLIGALLGYMYVWSGSLWIPILGHFINNASAVALNYFLGQRYMEEHIDKLGTQNEAVDWILLATSALFMIFLLRAFKGAGAK